MKRFLFVLLFSVISFVTFGAEATIEALSDSAMINFDNEEFTAQGGLHVKYDDIKIQANRVKKVKGKNVLIAYEKVIFNQNKSTVECESVEINLDDKSAKIEKARSFSDKIFYGGEKFQAKFSDKEAHVDNSYFSTCGDKEPHYKMTAKRIDFYLEDKIIAFDVILHIGKIPVFWFPIYISSVKSGGDRASLFPVIGSSEELGYYMIMGVDIPIYKDYISSFIDFEWSVKKGINIKNSVTTYKISDDNKGTFKVSPLRFAKETDKNEWEWKTIWEHIFKNKGKEGEFVGDADWKINVSKEHNTNKYKPDGTLMYGTGTKIDLTTADASIAQKLGKDMDIQGRLVWTDNVSLIKQIHESQQTSTTEQDKPRIILKQEASFQHSNSFDKIFLKYVNNENKTVGLPGDTFKIDKQKIIETSLLNPYNITLKFVETNKDNYDTFKYRPDSSSTAQAFSLYTGESVIKSYSVNLGNYNILSTKFYTGIGYEREEKKIIERTYDSNRREKDGIGLISQNPIEGVDYTFDPLKNINTKSQNATFKFGNSGIDTLVAGTATVDYKLKREFHTDPTTTTSSITKILTTTDPAVTVTTTETISVAATKDYITNIHDIRLELKTPIYNNTLDEFRDADITANNSIPFVYHFEETDAVDKKIPGDTSMEIGDSFSLDIGNIKTTYNLQLRQTYDGEREHYLRAKEKEEIVKARFGDTPVTRWVKTESVDNTYKTDISGDYISLNIKNSKNRDNREKIDFVNTIADTFGIELGLKENQNKLSFSTTKTQTLTPTAINTSELSFKDESYNYKYSNSRFGLEYSLKLKEATKYYSTGEYKQEDKAYTATYNNLSQIYPQTYSLSYSQGEKSGKKVPSVLTMNFTLADKSETDEVNKTKEEKDLNKFEYVKKERTNDSDNERFKLFKEEEEEIDDILKKEERAKIEKERAELTLKGVGEEQKKTIAPMDKSKSYNLNLTLTNDEEFRTTHGGIFLDSYGGSLTALTLTAGFKYSNFLSLTAGTNFSKVPGGTYISRQNDQSITFMFGQSEYEWEIKYIRKYDNMIDKPLSNEYILGHNVHCTRWDLSFVDRYLIDKFKYEYVIALKFTILAFPEKNLQFKDEPSPIGDSRKTSAQMGI